jgi:hypothetical protein
MTPQERDLITALLARLQQQANQPKDAEAEALIRQGMAAQPDAPYLLAQTVLIQDMALHSAQDRITALEQQLAAKAAPQPTSFLPGRGSVPAAGPWAHATPAQPPAAAAAPVWTGAGAAAPSPAAAAPMPSAPQMLAGGGSGFLRQAATTAAGIAGGALLFEGIQSMFGPHFGSGFLGGSPAQPGISETVVNNYYGDRNAPDQAAADAAPDQSADAGQADDSALDQDMLDTDIADAQDSGGGDSGFDV